jgi:t-SNARE complex subunit (syntaxin)
MDIGTELDESNQLLDTIGNKVDVQADKIQLLNEKTDKALNQVNSTTRLMIVACLACILAVAVVIVAVYFGLMFK